MSALLPWLLALERELTTTEAPGALECVRRRVDDILAAGDDCDPVLRVGNMAVVRIEARHIVAARRRGESHNRCATYARGITPRECASLFIEGEAR